MWIRTQSLYALIKCARISIQYDGEGYDIVEDGCIVLGTYSSEDKAMQVLNDIESDIETYSDCIFCMPEDYEV